MTAEATFVNTFVLRDKRNRYAEFLAEPKKRAKILDRLNHCLDFDERLSSPVPRGGNVEALLQSRGAPPTCHIIADGHPLDGCEESLANAISELDNHSFGYVIICVPDRLALYQPEAPAEAVLLEVVANE